MGKKYVITQMKDYLYAASFLNNECVGLNIPDNESYIGKIYVARVENIVKNLNCAFLNIEKGVKCYYSLDKNTNNIFLNKKNSEKINVGDKLLVQIEREPIKTKPAAATSKITLTGEYLVLSTDVKGITISEKTKNNENCISVKKELMHKYFSLEAKDEFKRRLNDTGIDISFGFILRTNSENADSNEVIFEAEKLYEQFIQIVIKAAFSKSLTLLYEPQPSYITEIKNIRLSELDEIVTDQEYVLENIKHYCSISIQNKVRLYSDELLPLYKLYSLETILSRILNKKVWLKCGGYIVIDETEALTVIDVNSGKMVQKKSGETAKNETFYRTNLEAAMEIHKQLMLRNISGIIIIDFINMNKEYSDRLIKELKQMIKTDPLKCNFEDITKLGLVELTRKKQGKTLRQILHNEKIQNLEI